MVDVKPWSRLRSEAYSLVSRNPRSSRLVLEVMNLGANDACLDIGCGPGAAVRMAAPNVARAVGTDRSTAMVRIAARRSVKHNNASFMVAPAEALPFGDDEFDVAWSIHAYHHWEAPASGLAEAARVLRPGGKLFIAETETRGSHGLSYGAAEHLAMRLGLHGFVECDITRRGRELIVCGEAGWS